ncbi:MAG TPA: SRPBCC family protein [Steroidobacteraceae bacterium]|nr:SRPBCC family protein [Steroidobacteraceae bacterium]
MNLSSALGRIRGPALRAASVRVSRQVAAGPERIFDAWLDAGQARAFLFADRMWDAISSKIDARVGGNFRVVRQCDGEEVEYAGQYLEIDRPHRLVFSLFVERYAHQDDRVIVELARVGGQSLLVLTHELSVADPMQRLRIRREWTRVVDRLAALLESARH